MEPEGLRQLLKQVTEELDACGAEQYKALRSLRDQLLRHLGSGEPIHVGPLVWEEMLRRARKHLPPAA